jgi:hypothetical protein
MRRLAWLCLPLLLAGCGGKKSAPPVSVTCSNGVSVYGVEAVHLSGDLVNGRPVLTFADPVNPGHTGTVTVPPREHCDITSGSGS